MENLTNNEIETLAKKPLSEIVDILARRVGYPEIKLSYIQLLRVMVQAKDIKEQEYLKLVA